MTLGAVASVQTSGIGGALSRATRDLGGAEGFGALLSQAGADAVHTLKAAESLSVQALSGELPVREVASAVMAAEQTLQLSMSVRDKIVSAYLELSRMQI
jgi:flagellar hook-basal body complex protein FliE